MIWYLPAGKRVKIHLKEKEFVVHDLALNAGHQPIDKFGVHFHINLIPCDG